MENQLLTSPQSLETLTKEEIFAIIQNLQKDLLFERETKTQTEANSLIYSNQAEYLLVQNRHLKLLLQAQTGAKEFKKLMKAAEPVINEMYAAKACEESDFPTLPNI